MTARFTIAITALSLLYAAIVAAGGTDAIADRVTDALAQRITAWQAKRTTHLNACALPAQPEQLVIIIGHRDGKVRADCSTVGAPGDYGRPRS